MGHFILNYLVGGVNSFFIVLLIKSMYGIELSTRRLVLFIISGSIFIGTVFIYFGTHPFRPFLVIIFYVLIANRLLSLNMFRSIIAVFLFYILVIFGEGLIYVFLIEGLGYTTQDLHNIILLHLLTNLMVYIPLFVFLFIFEKKFTPNVSNSTRGEGENLLNLNIYEKKYKVIIGSIFLISLVVPALNVLYLNNVITLDDINLIIFFSFILLSIVLLFNNFRLTREMNERRRVESALVESEEYYHQIVELLPSAIFIETDDKVVFANTAAVKLINAQNPDELIDKPITGYFLPDYMDIYSNKSQQVKDFKSCLSMEAKLVPTRSSVIDVELTLVPFNYQGKEAVQVIIDNITERKKMEEEFLRASKHESLALLAGGIAHDFKNILTVVLGNISLARINVDREDRNYSWLNNAEKAILQAKELTEQLQTFAKGGEPVKKVTAVEELLREVVSLSLCGTDVKCELFIPEKLSRVDIDESQISQVLNNLILNAVQAMPEGGTIKIFGENVEVGKKKVEHGIVLPEGRYVKISIQDEGTGIEKEHLQKIFDPFFTTKEEGTGLGLTTSYSIIKKHGGQLTLESEIGAGTTFHIYFPVYQGKGDVEAKNEEKLLKGPGRILIMDDDESIINVLSNMLSYLEYRVVSSQNGEEALEIFSEAHHTGNPFDAVIMDLTVPGGMGGKKLIKKLKEIDPDVKGIVSSGYSSISVMANHEKYGFKGVVHKPCQIEELSRTVYEVIHG